MRWPGSGGVGCEVIKLGLWDAACQMQHFDAQLNRARDEFCGPWLDATAF